MIYFLTFSFLFILGAIIGWSIELVFRRIVHHKWINPGFLVGPYLPLYGFGAAILYFSCRFFEKYMISVKDYNVILYYVIVILIMTIVMTLIEYITGLIFIQKMNIKLWDYSKRWGNIQGIICPLFTLAWGAVSALYMLFIDPLLIKAVSWLNQNLAFSFIVGLIGGMIIVDVCYSFKLSSKIKQFAKENKIIIVYENLKLAIRNDQIERKKKHHYILPFKSDRSLSESLNHYKNKMMELFKKNKNDNKKD